MSSDEEKERHRKHLKYKAKERRQRSEIAKRLLTDPNFKQRKSPKLVEREERQFKKYKRFETDEGNELLGTSKIDSTKGTEE